MITEVSHKRNPVIAEIYLPSSKSISNRVLIIQALGNLKSAVHNLSVAQDTRQLNEILKSGSSEINAGDGGTTLRFLMAYLCVKGSKVTLTASEAMRKRPVSQLVDALRTIGADIEYVNEEGKLPVKISGAPLTGKKISIGGSVSSQFISAVMLIGPYVSGGLTIEITGEILSLPYIKMTVAIMRYFGAEISFENAIVKIEAGPYKEKDIAIEPDWSAASYWYEIAALNKNTKIFLYGLSAESLQGDAAIAEMMKQFGVETTFTSTGAELKNISQSHIPDYFADDFSGCPDLGPAVAAVCAAKNCTADLHGLKNFRLKESDRAAAMQRELYNMNIKTDFCGGSKFKIYKGSGMRAYTGAVKTYNDHRIAMAFAPLALVTGKVLIEDSEVVNKSYPGFFEDLKRAGFLISDK